MDTTKHSDDAQQRAHSGPDTQAAHRLSESTDETQGKARLTLGSLSVTLSPPDVPCSLQPSPTQPRSARTSDSSQARPRPGMLKRSTGLSAAMISTLNPDEAATDIATQNAARMLESRLSALALVLAKRESNESASTEFADTPRHSQGSSMEDHEDSPPCSPVQLTMQPLFDTILSTSLPTHLPVLLTVTAPGLPHVRSSSTPPVDMICIVGMPARPHQSFVINHAHLYFPCLAP